MTPTATLTDEDWTRAKQHFDDIKAQYRQAEDMGANIFFAMHFTENGGKPLALAMGSNHVLSAVATMEQWRADTGVV